MEQIAHKFGKPNPNGPAVRGESHFTWRGDKSDDGKAWNQFMVIEAYRCTE